MTLATAATGIGKQVVTHAVRTWLDAQQERAQRDAELVDLVKIGVRDHFKQRKLVRQLEDLADQIAERLRPVYEHDFRDVAEGERAAALQAVVDALEAADLTDATLFAVDVDARKLARLVRERVPVRRVGLAEPAEQLYNAVLDESCMALVQVVKHLPAFEPRAGRAFGPVLPGGRCHLFSISSRIFLWLGYLQSRRSTRSPGGHWSTSPSATARSLTLMDMNEPVDLSPLTQTGHRLRVELRNTPTAGEPGPLIKVRRR